MTPESVGLDRNKMVLGKHSGKAAVEARLRELGYEPSQDEIKEIMERFKVLADAKKEVFDDDLHALMGVEMKEKYKLDHLTLTCGSFNESTATLQLSIDGKPVRTAEIGDGPVDAIFKAIKKLTKVKVVVTNYSVGSLTEGTDARANVSVTLEKGQVVVRGRGSSLDTMDASARAFIDALNRLNNFHPFEAEI
jgi:2-isopropylmalate synthase